MGSLVVSDPFLSASCLPNAALTRCSLVLISASHSASPIKHFRVTFLVFSILFEPEKLLKAGPDVQRTHGSLCLAFTYVNTDYLQDMGWKRDLFNYGTSQARLRMLVYTMNQVSLWNHICAVLLPIVSQVFSHNCYEDMDPKSFVGFSLIT